MTLFIDSITVGSPQIISSSSNVNLTSTDNFYVGSYANNIGLSPQFYFNGNISQVQIYNRALSSTEVLQNYKATKSRYI